MGCPSSVAECFIGRSVGWLVVGWPSLKFINRSCFECHSPTVVLHGVVVVAGLIFVNFLFLV